MPDNLEELEEQLEKFAVGDEEEGDDVDKLISNVGDGVISTIIVHKKRPEGFDASD